MVLVVLVEETDWESENIYLSFAEVDTLLLLIPCTSRVLYELIAGVALEAVFLLLKEVRPVELEGTVVKVLDSTSSLPSGSRRFERSK